MAKHVISSPRHSSQKTYCQNRDPGNPYSERYDYQAWSAWRAGLMELRFQPDSLERVTLALSPDRY
jgi:hypothetical protein